MKEDSYKKFWVIFILVMVLFLSYQAYTGYNNSVIRKARGETMITVIESMKRRGVLTDDEIKFIEDRKDEANYEK